MRATNAHGEEKAGGVTAWERPVMSAQAGVRCGNKDLIARGRTSVVVEVIIRNVSAAPIRMPRAPALMRAVKTGHTLNPGAIVVVGKMFVEYQRPLSRKFVLGPDNPKPLGQGIFHVGYDIRIREPAKVSGTNGTAGWDIRS